MYEFIQQTNPTESQRSHFISKAYEESVHRFRGYRSMQKVSRANGYSQKDV